MKFKIKEFLALIRPQQWVKNLFIFMPLFFVGQITDIEQFAMVLAAFVAFSLSASGVYVLNDLYDIEEDRQHPRKKYRPVASGSVSKKSASLLLLILFLLGTSLMAALSLHALGIVALYILLNIAYSLRIKHIAILDVTFIAIGFVLRLFVGSTVTGVPLSIWIVIMTFLLALFLALAKRRDDVLIFLDTGKRMRKVVDGYNLQLIDGAMTIMAAVVIVSYILYTTSGGAAQRLHSEYLYLTSLFVILGVMRYLQIALVEKDSSSPTRIVLRDRFTQAVIVAWIISFGWIIYL